MIIFTKSGHFYDYNFSDDDFHMIFINNRICTPYKWEMTRKLVIICFRQKCVGSSLTNAQKRMVRYFQIFEYLKTRTLVYQIHFIGWSKKWDIWSKEINILRWTRENLKKKDELMMTQVIFLERTGSCESYGRYGRWDGVRGTWK